MALRARQDRSERTAPDDESAVTETQAHAAAPEVDSSSMWAFGSRANWGRERRRLPDLRVAALTPPVIAIRWGALAVGFALASADVADGDTRTIAFGAVILAYAVFRTLRPIRYEEGPVAVWGVLAELALCVVVVACTGYWESPFVFSLMTAVIAAGFARGFTFAINSALGAAGAVAIPYLLSSSDDQALRRSAQWAFLLLLVALVAGYARRISGEADRQHSLALDRLGRLADANALLVLAPPGHPDAAGLARPRRRRSTPRWAGCGTCSTSTRRPSSLFDDTDGTWQPSGGRASGCPRRIATTELPAAAPRGR